MRNGCLPNLGSIYLWKRKSKKEEQATVKTKDTRVTEEIWIREDIDKSHVHDSSAANNSSLREKEVIAAKGIADENRDDSLSLDQNLRVVNVPKDEKLNENIPAAEQDLESVHVNPTRAEQDSAQQQAKAIRGCKGGDDFTITFGPKRPHNELKKAKTFVLIGVKSSGKERQANAKELNKVKTFDLRGVKSRWKGRESNAKEKNKVESFHVKGVKISETANEFHNVKTFDLRGIKINEKGREETANEFHKVTTFDLRGVKSSGKE